MRPAWGPSSLLILLYSRFRLDVDDYRVVDSDVAHAKRIVHVSPVKRCADCQTSRICNLVVDSPLAVLTLFEGNLGSGYGVPFGIHERERCNLNTFVSYLIGASASLCQGTEGLLACHPCC